MYIFPRLPPKRQTVEINKHFVYMNQDICNVISLEQIRMIDWKMQKVLFTSFQYERLKKKDSGSDSEIACDFDLCNIIRCRDRLK